jgi:hypothetical protein
MFDQLAPWGVQRGPKQFFEAYPPGLSRPELVLSGFVRLESIGTSIDWLRMDLRSSS